MSSYKGADCFMICVACDNPDSLTSVNQWKIEVQEKMEPNKPKPIVLILTQSDKLEETKNEETKDEETKN